MEEENDVVGAGPQETIADIDNGELFIFGDITAELAMDTVYAVLRMLEADVPEIHVYISSMGGSAAHAFTIVEILRQARLRGISVITYAMGGAASGAADIFLCGDTRLIGKYAYFVLHNAQLTVLSEEVNSVGVEAKLWQDRTKDFLVDVLKGTQIDYKYYFDKTNGKDWIISPKSAVKLGIADAIANDKKRGQGKWKMEKTQKKSEAKSQKTQSRKRK